MRKFLLPFLLALLTVVSVFTWRVSRQPSVDLAPPAPRQATEATEATEANAANAANKPLYYTDTNQIITPDTGSVLGVTQTTSPDAATTVTAPSNYIVNLHTDNTYFRVQDHGHDVLRVDYDKNITTMPGSTLHILGTIKDSTGSTGAGNQVLTAIGGVTHPSGSR